METQTSMGHRNHLAPGRIVLVNKSSWNYWLKSTFEQSATLDEYICWRDVRLRRQVCSPYRLSCLTEQIHVHHLADLNFLGLDFWVSQKTAEVL